MQILPLWVLLTGFGWTNNKHLISCLKATKATWVAVSYRTPASATLRQRQWLKATGSTKLLKMTCGGGSSASSKTGKKITLWIELLGFFYFFIRAKMEFKKRTTENNNYQRCQIYNFQVMMPTTWRGRGELHFIVALNWVTSIQKGWNLLMLAILAVPGAKRRLYSW